MIQRYSKIKGQKKTGVLLDGKERRVKNLTDDFGNPAGEWNTMITECEGYNIKVWVNGDFVNPGYRAISLVSRNIEGLSTMNKN